MPVYCFSINSTYEQIDLVVEALMDFLLREGCEKRGLWLSGVNFALRELLINAVEHGNLMNSKKKVCGRIHCSRMEVLIDIYDEGLGFDLESINTEGGFEENPLMERGRGIIALRNLGFVISVNKNHVKARIKLGKKV